MATIHDVAARAGVSAATVSRVLNGHASVNAEMAATVRRCIDELGYRPSHLARSMRTQRTGIVAVVVPDVENPFFTAVVRGIEDVARANGMMAVLCNSDDQPEAELRYLRLADDQRVDGIILASSMVGSASTRGAGPPAAATAPGGPMVLIDREVPGIRADLVLVDNVLGAREATRHLLESGARRLACITGPASVSTARQRLTGFLEALAEYGVPRREAVFKHADFRAAGARRAVAEILASEVPEGMLVCNNLMTLGALQELSARELRIPKRSAGRGLRRRAVVELVVAEHHQRRPAGARCRQGGHAPADRTDRRSGPLDPAHHHAAEPDRAGFLAAPCPYGPHGLIARTADCRAGESVGSGRPSGLADGPPRGQVTADTSEISRIRLDSGSREVCAAPRNRYLSSVEPRRDGFTGHEGGIVSEVQQDAGVSRWHSAIARRSLLAGAGR